MLRRIVRKTAYLFDRWYQARPVAPRLPALADCQFAWQWLNPLYSRLMAKDRLLRPAYTWGMIQAAYVASNLKLERISAIEFGVAGGNGLIALERVAMQLEQEFDIKIDIYGFDSGQGLPQPTDYRDLPNLWGGGAYPMDEAKLRSQLKRAELIIGMVEETIPGFLEKKPAPIGFISFDLDQYTSTMQAFKVLEADTELLMPRVYAYFDDILGLTYADFNGERLAIREFNELHQTRQISPIHGLRYYLPLEVKNANWSEKMFLAHIIDHEKYNEPDGLVVNARLDLS